MASKCVGLASNASLLPVPHGAACDRPLQQPCQGGGCWQGESDSWGGGGTIPHPKIQQSKPTHDPPRPPGNFLLIQTHPPGANCPFFLSNTPFAEG